MTYKRKMFERVCKYLGSDIDSEPCKALQEHLKKCPSCKSFVKKIKKTVEIYRIADECDSIPKDLADKLHKMLDLRCPDSDEKNHLR
jgi:predicted anti-sigma-YlaC factor YlaD